jgi:hypothetical protein
MHGEAWPRRDAETALTPESGELSLEELSTVVGGVMTEQQQKATMAEKQKKQIVQEHHMKKLEHQEAMDKEHRAKGSP